MQNIWNVERGFKVNEKSANCQLYFIINVTAVEAGLLHATVCVFYIVA